MGCSSRRHCTWYRGLAIYEDKRYIEDFEEQIEDLLVYDSVLIDLNCERETKSDGNCL